MGAGQDKKHKEKIGGAGDFASEAGAHLAAQRAMPFLNRRKKLADGLRPLPKDRARVGIDKRRPLAAIAELQCSVRIGPNGDHGRLAARLQESVERDTRYILPSRYPIAARVPCVNLPVEREQNARQAHNQNHQPREAADCEMKPEKNSAQALHASNLGPLAKKVVIHAGKLDGAGMVG